MRVGAISFQTNQKFTGENKKNNTLRNTAGAAAIALATAMPIEKADAQIYYPPPVYPIYPTYPVYSYNILTQPLTTIPLCFAHGDTKNEASKTFREMFDEIDANGNENGVISSNEVVRTERNNWNRENLKPFTSAQMKQTEKQFKELSKIYNEDNSDPNTMNFREYRSVMKDYVDNGPTENVRQILNILTTPYMYGPIVPPPPKKHHHHNHRHTPPHHRH